MMEPSPRGRLAPSRGRPLTCLEPALPPSQGRLVIASIHRQFQDLYAFVPSVLVFRGLCAYLSALLQWGWDLAPVHFDYFISEYTAFEKAYIHGSSYHHWLHSVRLPVLHAQGRKDPILSPSTLGAIASENPYTFAYARECLKTIARERRRGTSPTAASPDIATYASYQGMQSVL